MGRNRKQNVKRYPSGQINHRDRGNGHNGEPPDEVALWPRIKREAKLAAQHPILESEIGRLAYHNKITNQELDAGREWSKLVGKYRQLSIGAPNGVAKIASMEPSCKPASIDLDDLEEDKRSELIKESNKIKHDYERAMDILWYQGRETMVAIDELCVYDKCLTYDQLLLARSGLRALSRYFGFAKR